LYESFFPFPAGTERTRRIGKEFLTGLGQEYDLRSGPVTKRQCVNSGMTGPLREKTDSEGLRRVNGCGS